MSFNFQHPDHALRYARDAEAVNKKDVALKALRYFLTSKNLNREWTQAHERLVLRYFELCVEQRSALDAKEGIYRYRMLTHQNNPGSLNKVVMHLLDLALKEAHKARAEVKDSSALDKIEDLEDDASPETILMSSMSTETSVDRLERELLVPWVRHAWDTFRNILDQLRNVMKLEETYHRVARMAFDFCKDFNRTAEFRKLCSQMRLHLKSWRNYQEAHNESWTQETMERHITTKFKQLEHCADMEMWTEGYRTVDDIHTMMKMTGSQPAPQLMATYYKSLARIFWVSENYLFHAYALFKFYTLACTHPKTVKMEDKPRWAAAAVLASLCIPLFAGNETDDETYFKIDLEKDKKHKLAALLNFASTPSRNALMEDLRSRGVTKSVPAEMKSLFEDLEVKFNPLLIVDRVKPVLQWIKEQEQLDQYVPFIEKLLVHRMVEQLTRVYTTVKLSKFESMLDGISLSKHEVEQVIVRAVRSRQLSVRIDHHNGLMRLGEIDMESQMMRRQLSQLSTGLRTACHFIASRETGAVAGAPAALESRRKAMFTKARENLDAAQAEALRRRDEIERRKEGAERKRELALREEEARRAQEEAERKEAEAARVAEEQRRREQEKLQQLEEEQSLKEKEQLLQAAGKEVSSFTREELKKVDASKLQDELMEKRRKQAEEQQRRIEDKQKRLDYLIRAMRESEQEKLDSWAKSKLDEDEEYVKKQQKAILEKAKAKHDHSMSIKHRLVRVLPYRKEFEKQMKARRQAAYERERESILSEARKQFIKEKLQHAARRKHKADEDRKQRELDELRQQEAEREQRKLAEAQRLEEMAEMQKARVAAAHGMTLPSQAPAAPAPSVPENTNWRAAPPSESTSKTPWAAAASRAGARPPSARGLDSPSQADGASRWR